MDVSVQVAIVGCIGTVLTAVLAYLSKRHSERKHIAKENQYERELKFQADALSLKVEIKDWDLIMYEVSTLMAETSIDRFLIFCAWNGKDRPKWTTAIYQFRSADQRPVSYVHVEIDADYVDRLTEAKSAGELYFVTEEIPQSLIKSVYRSEGVTEAVWYPLRQRKLEGSESVALSYCSFATHTSNKITEHERVRCRMVVNRLMGAML